jgi:type IV pilus assembly protein PilM
VIAARKHGWIGIDFGTKVAKVAQLERAGSRFLVHRLTIDCLEANREVTCTGEQLREALDVSGRFSGRTVACTLPMSATDLRAMNIPPGSDAERRAMIAQEFEAAYADGVAREFDFWETDASAAQDSVNVLSVAKAKIEALIETLSVAGLECKVLDGLPCALGRAVALSTSSQGAGPVAAIDWGHASATVIIVEHGRPQFTRLLRDCGAGAMFAEVGQALGLNEAEAAEVLTRFGLPGPQNAEEEKGVRNLCLVAQKFPDTFSSDTFSADFSSEADEIGEVVLDIVGGQLQRIVDELTRTFGFLRLQRQSLLPKRLLLFGAGATVRNAATFLASRLETPCDIWRLANEEHNETETSGEAVFGPATALSALAWKL